MDVIDFGGSGDFAGQYAQAGVDEGFGGHAGVRVLREHGIEDGVGDLVGHFVGMAFGDGFGGEEVFAHGGSFSDGLDKVAEEAV